METSELSYNNYSVKEILQPTHYTLAYEKGELVRRGKKVVRGHEVTLYNKYTRLPRDIRADVTVRLLVEVAKATHSDPESVRQLLLTRYIEASKKMDENARYGIYEDVPVEPIRYTTDPRRKAIRIKEAPIFTSLS